MEFDSGKSHLELMVIWKDDEMIELSVKASNGRYFGTTQVYDTAESLMGLATSLADFWGGHQPIVYEAGANGGYAFWGMYIYLLKPSGLISVEVNLEENSNDRDDSHEKKNKVKLEIQVYTASIDRFRDELIQLAQNEEGVAFLYGENT
ncbi:hypothetical protein DYBT9623_05573 [Dyadobacter sp. CECT 9623]|uniref:Uncharacterized protein n=1 Tax=Dyadobacter linearis TaxID=2823330 RepID=A0ABM8UZQ6_9BACT|nr:hypothetical protein [Dyadobacter sp. CECT 9623]CAG5075091.1 hypothetical protein DYBT9623_05573 [Dyadobacter sp. CECT 9623]